MQGRIKLWNCGINLLNNDNIGHYSAEILLIAKLYYPFFQSVSLLRNVNYSIDICFLLAEKQKVLCTDSSIKRPFDFIVPDKVYLFEEKYLIIDTIIER